MGLSLTQPLSWRQSGHGPQREWTRGGLSWELGRCSRTAARRRPSHPPTPGHPCPALPDPPAACRPPGPSGLRAPHPHLQLPPPTRPTREPTGSQRSREPLYHAPPACAAPGLLWGASQCLEPGRQTCRCCGPDAATDSRGAARPALSPTLGTPSPQGPPGSQRLRLPPPHPLAPLTTLPRVRVPGGGASSPLCPQPQQVTAQRGPSEATKGRDGGDGGACAAQERPRWRSPPCPGPSSPQTRCRPQPSSRAGQPHRGR